jgi:hypothetical protein
MHPQGDSNPSGLLSPLSKQQAHFMKIITLKYNRAASAIQQSTVLSDEDFAMKDIYKLSRTKRVFKEKRDFYSRDEKKEYCISGTWQ